MNALVKTLYACAACACVLAAEDDLTNSVDAAWGDVSAVDVQGISLGMTRQEVMKQLGDAKMSAYATGVPYVFKEYSDATGLHYKLTVYFGVNGACSNKSVAIETTLFGASMTDRNTVVDALQEKFGFEDDYLEHRPKDSAAQLRNSFGHLPQHEQALNDHVSLVFRVDQDNKKQRTYLVTVMYRHMFYNLTVEYMRMARPNNEEARRKEQIRKIL